MSQRHARADHRGSRAIASLRWAVQARSLDAALWPILLLVVPIVLAACTSPGGSGGGGGGY